MTEEEILIQMITKELWDDLSDDQKDIMKELLRLLASPLFTKYQDIVDLFDKGLGDLIYERIAPTDKSNHHILNPLRELHKQEAHQALYIWHQLYLYLCEKERVKNERIVLSTVYFYIAEALFKLKLEGYGKFYLKAYMEDLGYHGGYDKAGAASLLIAYCYLGKNGLELIKEELREITASQDFDALRECVKTMKREELERLEISLSQKLSLEDNDCFFLPIVAMKEIITKIQPLKDKTEQKERQEKGRLLEQLCQLTFGSVRGFRYKFDERSHLMQIDGVIKNTSRHSFLSELGDTIIVEAKNYFEEKIGRQIIDIICMNMTRLSATTTFLVTATALTGPADDEIHHEYTRSGKLIINISLDELEEIANGNLPLPMLISKKISDIKAYRKLN